ncbi:alpha/beta-hydrolase [Rhodofomes roseus]|uniref:Alpha/beta-hydrolase n=1 Tax=Rhodofomes roseus TaxID=34475 RepID=A0ABQ8KNZ5_9APHY|nr:alpha/beta-hydrolase [Rhodofomes roseus]KAH9840041.1 alpha/beta-hydrolase [Rhodofomes roseus]
MSEGLCQHCVSGVRHEGTPEGKIEKIGGAEAYIATPSGDYDKTKVVIIATDVFGIPLNNNKLLADTFAQNGYRTVVPEYLNNDPVPEDAFDAPGKFDVGAWFGRQGPSVWKPVIDSVVAALKAEGVTRIGVTGYCYGAPPALYLAYNNISAATVLAHPSLLKPEDLEKYRDESKVPILINSCETDSQFPPDFQAKADEIFKGFAPGYERLYWEGCTHGFAVRGDISDPKIKAGKEGAFEATVKFFKKHL